MNLFDIPEKFKSHPDYPYRSHILNMAAGFNCPQHGAAACFHDFGKLHRDFQQFITNIGKSDKTTHAVEGAFFYLLLKQRFDPQMFPVFLSILRHHGNLIDVNNYMTNNFSDDHRITEILNRINDICRSIELTEYTDECADEIAEQFDTVRFVQDFKLGGLYGYFSVKSVFSKLIFTDKYEAIFKAAYSEQQPPDSLKYTDRLLNFIGSKSNAMSEVRNTAREEIISNYKKNSDKNIFIIEAPTGLGKTFTALHLALEICTDKQKKKLICTLPMTSIIDQTFEEYGNIIDAADLVRAHHLTSAKNYAEDNPLHYQTSSARQKNDYVNSSWCYDKIVITTFNQLFNAFFSNKNKDLIKFWTLKDSVVIIDEVQAVPRRIFKDVSIIIKYLADSFNIDFILMSATIPDIKAYLPQDSYAELLDNSYYSMSFNNRYTLYLDKSVNTPELLTERIVEASKKYNSVLCVVNTKKLCLQIFELLDDSGYFNDDELHMLSTNHIPLHRKEIINNLKSRIKNKKTILISTQVIEAGVDLDFDTGFREFAPLSSIIQTAGRVNREGLKHNAPMIITDKIGNSPYDDKDVLYNEVSALFSDDVQEKDMLQLLKKYFETARKMTSPDPVFIHHMEALNFETAFIKFGEHFMKGQPDLLPLFIETEYGLYERFKELHDQSSNKLAAAASLEEKMDARSELHELNKKISQYTINLRHADLKGFSEFYPDSDMRWCPFTYIESGSKYSFKKGWFGGYNEIYL